MCCRFHRRVVLLWLSRQALFAGSVSVPQAPSELPSLRLCSRRPQSRKHFFLRLFVCCGRAPRPGNSCCSRFRFTLMTQFAQCTKLVSLIFRLLVNCCRWKPVIFLSHQIKRLEDPWFKLLFRGDFSNVPTMCSVKCL
jgi:hypothetical protein